MTNCKRLRGKQALVCWALAAVQAALEALNAYLAELAGEEPSGEAGEKPGGDAPGPDGQRSAAPTADVTTVAKTRWNQYEVDFALTSVHAGGR